ncbi:suppressor of fused domain protein [Priestia koreensis]|nr:suppressor of fused domain protein [Priestia koreensis]
MRWMANEQERIIQKATEVFGVEPTLESFSDEGDRYNIQVASVENQLREDTTSFVTIGGYEAPTGYTVGGVPLRIELVGACQTTYDIFADILAHCVYHKMKSHVSCFPGALYKDMITPIDPDLHMQHVLLIPPVLWEDFSTIDADDKKITWLQVIPISEKERIHALQHGVDSLLRHFEEAQVNIFNLERKSVM